MYTLAKCRKYVPGFGLPAFKADALRLYEDACSGIARSDRTLLRQARLSHEDLLNPAQRWHCIPADMTCPMHAAATTPSQRQALAAHDVPPVRPPFSP